MGVSSVSFALLSIGLFLSTGATPPVIDAYLKAYEAKDIAGMAQTLGDSFVYFDYPREPRYTEAAAFTKALSQYLAGQEEQGITVKVAASCRAFRARTSAGMEFYLCDHASAYRGGGADHDENFIAIYGLQNDHIASIERLGDLAGVE